MNIQRDLARCHAAHRLQEPISITTVLIGAAIGGVTAAVSGGNILKGALLGGLGAGVASGLSSAFGAAGAATSAATGGVEAAAAGAGADAVGAGMASAAEQSAITGAMGDAAAGGGAAFDPLASADMGGAPVVGSPVGTGTEVATGGVGTGVQAPTTGTGMLGSNPTDMRLAAQTQTAPMSATDGGSFLDSLLNKGKGMLNSPMAMNTAGQVLKGYAAGSMQEKQLEARKAEIDAARHNARFASTGSRYGGMITAPVNYK